MLYKIQYGIKWERKQRIEAAVAANESDSEASVRVQLQTYKQFAIEIQQKTKGVNLNFYLHFADKSFFFISAKNVIKHKASTDPDIFKLKKHMIKFRKFVFKMVMCSGCTIV